MGMCGYLTSLGTFGSSSLLPNGSVIAWTNRHRVDNLMNNIDKVEKILRKKEG
jgi:hypothetical protein